MPAVTLPVTFQAVALEQVGRPLASLPRTIPTLQPNELLVHVHYSSIQPMEVKLAASNPFHAPLPLFLGGDISGRVVAVGGAASEGQEELGVGSEVWGFTVLGGCWGEYAVVQRPFTALRGGIPDQAAGTLGGVFLTAADSLLVEGHLIDRKGQWIYVAGAAGGVGHVAVQLAKLHGLRVLGSASKPASLALLASLGVDHVIDYSKQDVVAEVLRVTGGKGADVVYDPTYESTSFAQSAACVASGGLWIKLGLDAHQPGSEQYSRLAQARGATTVTPTLGRWLPEYGGQQPLINQQSRMTATMRDAVRWYESGKLKVHVSRSVECEPKAMQQAMAGFYSNNVGKIAVRVLGSE